MAQTHDHLWRKSGTFDRVVRNIARLGTVTEPVINTVVNKRNISELTEIIRIGKQLGVSRFKFFPQKAVGRGAATERENLLNNSEIQVMVDYCQSLAVEFDVEIASVEYHVRCGSARSGFAIDEIGDIYPCIFGIANRKLRSGNILADDLDEVWFNSKPMKKMRVANQRPCHACEIDHDS